MNQLISALLDKNAITKENVITASYTVRDGSGRSLHRTGDFGIVSLERFSDQVRFTLQHMTEKNRVRVDDSSILAIDGMDPRRYADVYDLNDDGSEKKIGKKRGRKPKQR